MTNEEALKKAFPDIDCTEKGGMILILLNHVGFTDFRAEVSTKWWNAPYKAESEDKE